MAKKECTRCHKSKAYSEFNAGKDEHGKHRWCRQCQKDYYQENKERHIARVRANKERVAQENRERLQQLKSELQCEHCGYDEHTVALDFHHLGDKTNNVGRMIYQGYSWERIEEEIEKCIVLCANCHRVHHHAPVR